MNEQIIENIAGLPEMEEMCQVCKTAKAVQKCTRCNTPICRSCWAHRNSETMAVTFCLRCRDEGINMG